MQIVRFTKFWASLSVEALAERALALGYDGLDLVVRPGYAVHPENIEAVLPDAVARWAEMGIGCPLLTAQTTLIDPASRAARILFESAGRAGVGMVKLGYFEYQPGTDLEAEWTRAQRALAGFADLAERTGVRAVYHTHSGTCLGSNCAGLRHLLENHDPRHVGAYVDLGHLAINGEDVRLGLPLIRRHLAAVGAKDAHHVPDPRPERRAGYTDAFVPLGEGAGEIAEAVEMLKQWQFDGPVSVHTEYTADPSIIAKVGARDDSPAMVEARERGEITDLAFLRRLGI